MTELWPFAAGLAAGAGFGALYFALLWRGTQGFTGAALAGGPGAGRLLFGFVLRLALAAGALALALQAGAGAGALLAAALGFTLTRQVLIRRLGRRG
jgi:hypothetical protein